MSSRRFIFIPVIIVIVICTATTFILSWRHFTDGMYDVAHNKVEVGTLSVIRKIEAFNEPARLASIISAQDPNLISAVATSNHDVVLEAAHNIMHQAQTDFCTILDSNGIVLARTHEPDIFSDDLSYQYGITSALTGMQQTTVEPGNVILLSVRSAAPIIDDGGNVIGVVSLGYRFDHPDFVNTLKEITGCEIFIYRGNECINTTMADETGFCPLNSLPDANSIIDSTLKGNEFFGEIVFNGRSLLANFLPITGPEDTVVGAIGVADFWREDNKQLEAFRITSITIAITFILIAAAVSLMVTYYVNRRLRSLVKKIEETSKNRDALMEVKTMLGTVLDGIDAMIYVSDPGSNELLFVNKRLLDFFNLVYDDIIGKKCYSVFRGSDKRCDFCPCNKLSENPELKITWNEELGHIGRTVLHSDCFINWHTGSKVHLQYAIDITDMERTQKELEHQNLRLNLLISGMNLGLWDTYTDFSAPPGTNNYRVIWSDELRRLFGFSNEEDFPNTLESWSDRIHPDDMPAVNDAIGAFYNDRTGATPYNAEYRLMMKDGQYRWFRSFGSCLRDENGDAYRTVGATEDITEQKEAEFEIAEVNRQLKQALHSAESANKAKSAFLANMSHEIRTPMNAILGIAENQLRDRNMPPEMEEDLEIIYESGNLLLNIINDILDLSKIEAGKMEIIPVNYDLPSLINDTIQLIHLRYDKHQIEFVLDIDAAAPINLFGDELRIKQILNNILSNAYKYTDRGEVKFSVSAETYDNYPLSTINSAFTDNNAVLVFTVSDTGHGMTKEQLGMLFDEYKRFNTEANRTTVGTGLGMSITKQLVTLMHGTIDVESEVGEGTTITVKIPQKRLDELVCGAGLNEKLLSFKFQSSVIRNKGQMIREYMPYGSVLIVDDVESNTHVTRGMLKPYGLKIDSASSGFSAIDKIKDGNVYDIIFMDHMMPYMDGIETVKILREQYGYKNTIIALTANALVGQAEIFLDNGFNGFISKPIDSRELNLALNEFIRNKQSPDVIQAARDERALLQRNNATGNSAGNGINAGRETNINSLDSELIEMAIMDVTQILGRLEEMNIGNVTLDDEQIDLYRISVHGIKGALYNIKEKTLAEFARRLELAAQNKNTEIIGKETPLFINDLKLLLKKLKS